MNLNIKEIRKARKNISVYCIFSIQLKPNSFFSGNWIRYSANCHNNESTKDKNLESAIFFVLHRFKCNKNEKSFKESLEEFFCRPYYSYSGSKLESNPECIAKYVLRDSETYLKSDTGSALRKFMDGRISESNSNRILSFQNFVDEYDYSFEFVLFLDPNCGQFYIDEYKYFNELTTRIRA